MTSRCLFKEQHVKKSDKHVGGSIKKEMRDLYLSFQFINKNCNANFSTRLLLSTYMDNYNKRLLVLQR